MPLSSGVVITMFANTTATSARRSLLLLVCTVHLAATTTIACGGSEADAFDEGGAQTTEDATTGGTDAADDRPGDDAPSSADSARGDTGTGGGIDGGLPSNPGAVWCGAAICRPDAGQYCCAHFDGGHECRDAGTACSGFRERCDEKADCPPGELCCFEFGVGIDTACLTTCFDGGSKNGRVQACRTQAECTTGTCTVRFCGPGGGMGSIESCTPISTFCP